jgi:hypothetical protein
MLLLCFLAATLAGFLDLGGVGLLLAFLYVVYLVGWIVWNVFQPSTGGSIMPTGIGQRHLARVRAQDQTRSAQNRAFHNRANQRNR